MATLVLLSPMILINAVDLSDHATQVDMPLAAAQVDFTNFGSGGTYEGKPGIRSGTMSITFLADEASAKVQQTLFPLWSAGTIFAVEVRPVNTGRTATNPGYTANAFITSMPPVGGGVGQAQTTVVNLQLTGAITRATA